jgi:hypothetical protein
MKGVKDLAMDVSYALGLDGEITQDVQIFTERIIQNILNNSQDKAIYALESMKISKDFRALRAEIAETKVMKAINEGLIVFANEAFTEFVRFKEILNHDHK